MRNRWGIVHMIALEDIEGYDKLEKSYEELKKNKKIITNTKENKKIQKKTEDYIWEYKDFIVNGIFGKYIKEEKTKFKNNISENLELNFGIKKTQYYYIIINKIISGICGNHNIEISSLRNEIYDEHDTSTPIGDDNFLYIRIALQNSYDKCIGISKSYGHIKDSGSFSSIARRKFFTILITCIILLFAIQNIAFSLAIKGGYKILILEIIFLVMFFKWNEIKEYYKIKKQKLRKNKNTKISKYYRVYSNTTKIEWLENENVTKFLEKYKKHIKFFIDKNELVFILKPIINIRTLKYANKEGIFEPNLSQELNEDKVLKFYIQFMEDFSNMINQLEM
jgi:hypothetical protein